jgi:hypothetical protein
MYLGNLAAFLEQHSGLPRQSWQVVDETDRAVLGQTEV